MIKHTTLNLSGSRFAITYVIHADQEDARDIARKICIEQTIEFPADLIADDDIRGKVIGQIESLFPITALRHQCTISYADELSSFALPQLLNVIYGNVSLFRNVRVERLQLSEAVAAAFKGPRFGRDGLRSLFRRPAGPLFMSALKPQGLSAAELAGQARALAAGGLDIVKDDHGLADQRFSPFRERVQRCCEAVRQANAQTGGNTVYAPMISSPSERIFEDAQFAKEQGAGALLVSPGLIGFDTARRLAESDEIDLPVIGHPALIGSYVVPPVSGFSFYAFFGQLMRLIGMDASIFPNHGGRFAFSRSECSEIVEGCADPMNQFASILPSPGGGMTFDIIPSMSEFYGDNVLYLVGGELHRHNGGLSDACRRLREIATAAKSEVLA